MSRRRTSWQAVPAVETDELLTAMFGQQQRQERVPVRGRTARCCWPGSAVVDAEGRIRRVVWTWLSSELVVLLAVLALIWSASRGLRW